MHVVDMPACALAKQPAQWATLPTHRQRRSNDGFILLSVDDVGVTGQVGKSLEALFWSGGREVLQTQSTENPAYSPTSKGATGYAWLASPDGSNFFDWAIMARTTSGALVRVGDSQVGNAEGRGQFQDPGILNGRVAWSKPMSATDSTAAVTVTNLKDKSVTTLDSGRTSAPVLVGKMLVWARVDSAGAFSFRAANADTLRPVPLPALPTPDGILYLAGSDRQLAWTNTSYSHAYVWEVGSTTVRRYTPVDDNHAMQFIHITDNPLAWDAATASSVIDLRTGAMFDTPSFVTAGHHLLAVSSKYRPTGPTTIDAWDSRTLPPLPCTPLP